MMSARSTYADGVAGAPFAPALVVPRPADTSGVAVPAGPLSTPFRESLSADGDAADTMEALLAEFEDDEFADALEALADDAAARHLRTDGLWSGESPAPLRDEAEAQLWMEGVASAADSLLSSLETRFGDRPADTVSPAEIDAAAGEAVAASPVDAQERFLGALVNKVKKVAAGVAKVAGRFFPMAVLMRALRRLIRPLLQNVLRRGVGRLPAPLRPLATRVAGRFTGEAEDQADEADDAYAGEAEAFDRRVAAFVTRGGAAGDEATPDGAAVHGGPEPDLDAARARLVHELTEATPGEPPTAQLERFIPAVMAAMPLIRTGVRFVGRDRIVGLIARGVAPLLRSTVGPQAAQTLSRHIANVGLQLLGLEAEAANGARGSTLGMEAIAAAVEDTVRDVASLPAASLAENLLVEAEVQDAFARAVNRHVPRAVLRPEVAERDATDEEAVWVLMPRAARPSFRYKKLCRIVPVRITRPVARCVRMAGGDTLEERLLDAGIAEWPASGELELYELLAGGQVGHIAAFEADPGQDVLRAAEEFELLDEGAAGLLAGNPSLAATGRRGRRGPRGQAGTRYYRLRVAGTALRRRRVFTLRLDLTASRPVLHVRLFASERVAHGLAAHLDARRMPQVVSVVRGLVGPARRPALAERLERLLGRRGLPVTATAARQLADQLADAVVAAVSQQLPAAAATLAQAAKDPAPGVTLAFAFTFADRAALGRGAVAAPTLTIRPGWVRD